MIRREEWNAMSTNHRAVVNTHKHSTQIEGLDQVIEKLKTWNEIDSISVGSIKSHRASSGNDNSVSVKVVGWITTGAGKTFKRTSILCRVRKGSSIQDITLFSKNLDLLKERLRGDPAINAENLLRSLTF